MQIALWLFGLLLSLALTWDQMASHIFKRSFPFPTPLKSILRSPSPSHRASSFNQFITSNNPAAKHFTQSTSKMSASPSTAFLETLKNRRTIYALKKESPISDKKVEEIVTQALLHIPSPFNSQSSRAVLLVKEEHDKLWEITKDVLKGIVPAENFPATEQKLNMFKGGYGTVLFFVSRSVVTGMQEKFPLYADKFPVWATHSDGMHQIAVWSALEAEGLGANLQHYNPLIDKKVAAEWEIPEDWELSSQLVFGGVGAPAGEKAFDPIEQRFKVFGA